MAFRECSNLKAGNSYPSETTQKIRIGNIIANLAWAIYNICTGLYIVLIMRAVTILSNLIAYNKYKNNEKSGNPV